MKMPQHYTYENISDKLITYSGLKGNQRKRRKEVNLTFLPFLFTGRIILYS